MVPVIYVEGSDQQIQALNLALNKIHGEWDEAKLADVLAELADVDSLQEALAGFDTDLTELAGFSTAEVLASLEASLKGVAPSEAASSGVGPPRLRSPVL